jgi:hypothetical protein
VNFWGAQWQKNNVLSVGNDDREFKGFEGDSTVPTCGSSWVSRPGNSSMPPDSIPPYMAIIVSSNIKKNGSTLTGDIKRILIVKTGTVVALLCSVE